MGTIIAMIVHEFVMLPELVIIDCLPLARGTTTLVTFSYLVISDRLAEMTTFEKTQLGFGLGFG